MMKYGILIPPAFVDARGVCNWEEARVAVPRHAGTGGMTKRESGESRTYTYRYLELVVGPGLTMVRSGISSVPVRLEFRS